MRGQHAGVGREKRARHRERAISAVGGEPRDAKSPRCAEPEPGFAGRGERSPRDPSWRAENKIQLARGGEGGADAKTWDRKGRRRMGPGRDEPGAWTGQGLSLKIPPRDPMTTGRLWAEGVGKGGWGGVRGSRQG